MKRVKGEVYMPLIHRPGEAQVDFGYALVKEAGLKKQVLDFMRENEDDFESYQIRFDRSVWIRGLSKREDIDFFNELTDEMFEKRNTIGIWFIGKKEYYIRE